MAGIESYELFHNFPVGKKGFLTHTAKVKVGAKVKAGDVLATSNFTDSHGVLALGRNLTCAVMPYRSYNFEDAYVLSRSG